MQFGGNSLVFGQTPPTSYQLRKSYIIYCHAGAYITLRNEQTIGNEYPHNLTSGWIGYLI